MAAGGEGDGVGQMWVIYAVSGLGRMGWGELRGLD